MLAAGQTLPYLADRLIPPLQGPPAYDPAEISLIADDIALPANTAFEHPLLERAVRVGLAHIDATFRGDHPRYGAGAYAQEIHDGFPPTIIATVDALTLWGHAGRAESLFGYWLRHFVRDDGSIAYYGPSISEYGQLLTTARRLMERGGTHAFLATHEAALARVAARLQDAIRGAGGVELVAGAPEADEADQTAAYFHNNAWVVRGVDDWAALLEGHLDRSAAASAAREAAGMLRTVLLDAIDAAWPRDVDDWWLRPMAEAASGGYWSRPAGRVTASRLGSYTNYRYWPELLSSGVLPEVWLSRIVAARLTSGGQLAGATRFEGHLDDWPLMDYLEGLWRLGRRDEYRACLWGHLRCHQADGHLTAYEQVTLPPGRPVADYCLPCQLVAVRAARRLV